MVLTIVVSSRSEVVGCSPRMEDAAPKCGDLGGEAGAFTCSTEDEHCGSNSSVVDQDRGTSGSEEASLPQDCPSRKTSDSDPEADDKQANSNRSQLLDLRGRNFFFSLSLSCFTLASRVNNWGCTSCN